ncbi:MAG TPA: hypothetical protein VEZ20_10495 [Allosphingosinicella sp.]|jgi:hypothetical protein|nr:hypothetical protein [Allosphingosinicella sp.]
MTEANSIPAPGSTAELSAEEIAAVSGGNGLIGSSGKDGGGTSTAGG